MSEARISEALEALEGVFCQSPYCPGPDGDVEEVEVESSLGGTVMAMAGPCGVCRAIQALRGAVSADEPG